jgi:hypothetical protein
MGNAGGLKSNTGSGAGACGGAKAGKGGQGYAAFGQNGNNGHDGEKGGDAGKSGVGGGTIFIKCGTLNVNTSLFSNNNYTKVFYANGGMGEYGGQGGDGGRGGEGGAGGTGDCISGTLYTDGGRGGTGFNGCGGDGGDGGNGGDAGYIWITVNGPNSNITRNNLINISSIKGGGGGGRGWGGYGMPNNMLYMTRENIIDYCNNNVVCDPIIPTPCTSSTITKNVCGQNPVLSNIANIRFSGILPGDPKLYYYDGGNNLILTYDRATNRLSNAYPIFSPTYCENEVFYTDLSSDPYADNLMQYLTPLFTNDIPGAGGCSINFNATQVISNWQGDYIYLKDLYGEKMFVIQNFVNSNSKNYIQSLLTGEKAEFIRCNDHPGGNNGNSGSYDGDDGSDGDVQPSPGSNIQFDLSASFKTISDDGFTKSVNNSDHEIKIFDNIQESKVEIYFICHRNEVYEYLISDLLGKIIKKGVFHSIIGENRFSIDLDDVTSGTYFMSIITRNGSNWVKKIMIE